MENPSLLLTQKIIDTILASPQQKITFSDYMNLCLYSYPYGYYNWEKTSIGFEGDFFTSSTLSEDFGELLAKQLVQFWEILDKPSPFHLVEIGAGEGNLSLTILRCLQQNYHEIYSNLQYIIIENSTTFRRKQADLLKRNIPGIAVVKWCSLEEIEDNSIQGVFFSNELFDAFPVNIVEKKNNKLKEVYVAYNPQRGFVEVVDELSTEKILEYLAALNVDLTGEEYPENYRTEVNLRAVDWLEKISRKIKQGYLLTIDYGYTAEKYYHPQRFKGTLKCYYRHRHHDNPYVNIGCQDITSHVNFSAIQTYGEKWGLQTLAYTSQALFLMDLGLGERLAKLSEGNMGMRELIRRRYQLHQLVNPEGLGGFKVLLQAKNLTSFQKSQTLTGFQHLHP
ncbi:MAG: class I SAM-dependent methyltransferase [Geminocystis sp.]|nr:class I SAM-dependent methyltransferase [Geminocystis sp.]MCX8077206.1 class I SAM-dependent methyltransferase [Geminocystis sp.]MDW8463012.1 class I SAM-dependent methyltransferase [Geminocystis sp.]